MAFISMEVSSDVLSQVLNVDVFLPNDVDEKENREAKAVFYILHGHGSASKQMAYNTALYRYARDLGVAIVSPVCPRGWYVDMKYGGAYHTYITEELPSIMHKMFKLPQGRDKTFVMGLSMGGYGALMTGLARPDLYGGLAAFSGVVDLAEMLNAFKDMDLSAAAPDVVDAKQSLICAFGEQMELPDKYNNYKLAAKVAAMPKTEQPKIFISCGLEDDLANINMQNDAMNNYLKTLDLASYKYMTWHGVHHYSFWDRSLAYAFAFLLGNAYDKKVHLGWTTPAKEG